MESGGRDPSNPPTPTAEEEAVKRNTDCVYFLASPLTCKKGNECEYRHSEGARVNPRDCWFWLNGNCLNPKCSFRHPPLDGLLGTPRTTPSGSALAPLQAPTLTEIPLAHSPAVHNSNKQSVPCHYFQKGVCLKGDRCPFMHGPQPIGNPVLQQLPKVVVPVLEPLQTFKKPSWGLEKCASQQNVPKVSADKPVEVTPSLAKPVVKTGTATSNGLAVKISELPIPLGDEHPPRPLAANLPVSSDNAPSIPRSRQVQPLDEHFQNGREAGEFWRESSPGFDVLVNGVPEDPDYYQNENEFGGTSGHGVRNLNSVNDFDYPRVSDYDTAAEFERESYNGIVDYDRYGQEHRRASSERIVERPSMPERRRYRRDESPDEIDGLDLRHRLLKQRKLNGSRSAVSSDHRGEPYPRDNRYLEEQRYRDRSSRRDQRPFPRESSISNRLKGRITVPVRSSSDNLGDLRSERERDIGRNRGRSSPGRPVNYPGRHHDRINQRTHEDFTAEARNFVAQPIRRDEVDPLGFAAPKSLAELKGAKFSDSYDERSTKTNSASIPQEQRNMKLGKALGHQEAEGSLSFEGPKPLSVILKRKREAAPGNAAVSGIEEESNQRDREGIIGGSVKEVVSGTQTTPLVSKKEADDPLDYIGEPLDRAVEEEEEEGLISTNGENLSHEVQSSAKGDTPEMEDGTIMDNMEDPELENYVQRDGEFDYEAMEVGDFKTEDDDNAYQDDEDLDDEDGDDFARKLGIMFA